MKLREPESLRVLDQHHRRVRHVDSHLDHRRRDEHLRVAARKLRHRLLALACVHRAVEQYELERRQRAGAQPLELRGRRAHRFPLRVVVLD